jgi:predicted transcriptional regulator
MIAAPVLVYSSIRFPSGRISRQKQGARISFASEDLLWRTLTPKRWALLKLMAGQGPMAIREIARRAKREVRAVHSDVHVLLRVGFFWKGPRKVALCLRMTPFM